VQRAHDNGSLVMHTVGDVPEAARAAEAPVDVIVAQGTEGGGHVGWMASMPLVPMVVQAVAPVPVIAAAGIADGRGLAAALALGADGALVDTRFLATTESPLHPNFKQAIVASDGHDTTLSEIPDIVSRICGRVRCPARCAIAPLSNGLGGNGTCAAGRPLPLSHSRRHASQATPKVYRSLLARTPA
jgi:enoyl-[acyl-carrier protein] reductase II